MKIRFRSGAVPEVFDVIRKYVEPGKKYVIEISEERTPDQNKYFHAVVVPAFSQCTGYSREKAKRMLKKGFGVSSTAELTEAQMADLITCCRIWLWHHHRCALPEAGNMDDDMSEKLMIDLEKTYII